MDRRAISRPDEVEGGKFSAKERERERKNSKGYSCGKKKLPFIMLTLL